MNVLLSNDDGIHAPGLVTLAEVLQKEHDCLIVAPATEKSACGHSISLGQKLIIDELDSRRFAVCGTPADAIKFALSELSEFQPDVLVSGINPGPNTGVSVFYSGTISAAREGLINRIPSMAISIGNKNVTDFSFAASFAKKLLKGYAENAFPVTALLNVNIPDLPEAEIRGIKIVRQAPSRFVEEFVREDVFGKKRVYRLAGEIKIFDPDGTTDEEALREGFISITPLHLDLTDGPVIQKIKPWFHRKEPEWLNLKSI